MGGVISADSHVSPPYTMWAQYLPESLRCFAPRLEQTGEGDFLVIDGHRAAYDRLANLAGAATTNFTHRGKIKDDERAGAWDPVVRLVDQDADGVAVSVLMLRSHRGDRRCAAISSGSSCWRAPRTSTCWQRSDSSTTSSRQETATYARER